MSWAFHPLLPAAATLLAVVGSDRSGTASTLSGSADLGAATGTRSADEIAYVSGHTAPVTAGNTGTIGSVTTASFDVGEAATLVAVLGFGNYDGGDRDPYTVAWNGGTPANATAWTKQVEGILAPGTHSGSVWVATCSAALTGVSVTASGTSGSNTAIALAVHPLKGADPTPGVSNQTSSAGNNRITLTGVTAGSWLFVAGCFEAPGTVTPVTNTEETRESLIGGVSFVSATGYNRNLASGNIEVGWAGTYSFGAIAALEIKVAAPSGDTRSGTAVTLSGTAATSTADGTKAVSATVAALSGTGALGAAAGTKAVSQSVASLTGTAATGTATGAKAVSATVASLTGTAALSTADGTAAEARSGTALDLTGTGTLSAPTATRAVSGTVSSLTGTGAVSTGTGSKAVSNTAASLTGTAALSTATGAKAASSTAAALAGAGDLSTAAGTKAVSGTVASLTGTATLSTATGTNGVSSDRTGTGTSLTETGALGTLTGAKAVSSTVATLSGAASLSTLQGYSAKAGTAEALAGLAALGQATGISSEPEDPSGPSSLRPYLTHSRLGHQRPQWNRHYQRRMKGHS